MHWRLLTFLLAWILTLVGSTAASGAESAPFAKGPYLGLKPPGMTAEVFAPGLVSGGDFEHSRLEISRDGKTLYWIVQPQRRKQLIWTTHCDPDGVWSKPAPLPIANGSEELPFLHSPTLSPDNRTLYFSSIDWGEEKGHGSASHKQNVYAVDLQDPRWDAPRPFSAWFPNPERVWAYSFAANGNLYFDSDFRLFVMKRRGDRYDPPVPLGNPAIDGCDAFVPFVAPDEGYIIFSSSEKGVVENSIDLFVAFRLDDGGWGEPKSLGPAVNTAANERFPSVSPDGRYLFFLRNEPRGDSSFYWIDAAVIKAAK